MNRLLKKGILFVAILLALSVVALAGCGGQPEATTTPKATPTPSTVLVTNSEGTVSVEAPIGWNTADTGLYPSAVIGVSDTTDMVHAIVLIRSKASIASGTTVSQYLVNVKNAFGLVLKSPVWSAQSNITVNGLKGITLHLTGTSKTSGKDMEYTVNILEDSTNFYSVDCYAVKSSYDAAKATLDMIGNSFKVK